MTYLTDDTYWLSRPDALQPLRAMVGGSPERNALAHQLEQQGAVIDKPIDVWGWSAPLVMAYRQSLGLKTAPSATQAMPGTIKVSIDAADYPPVHPATPTPPPASSPVGAESPTPGVYTWTPAAFDGHGKPLFAEGQAYTMPNGMVVTFHIYKAPPFDMQGWLWETAAAKASRLEQEATAVKG